MQGTSPPPRCALATRPPFLVARSPGRGERPSRAFVLVAHDVPPRPLPTGRLRCADQLIEQVLGLGQRERANLRARLVLGAGAREKITLEMPDDARISRAPPKEDDVRTHGRLGVAGLVDRDVSRIR